MRFSSDPMSKTELLHHWKISQQLGAGPKFQNAISSRRDALKCYEKNHFPIPMKQRPMQTVLKRKQMLKDQPAKPEPKVSTSETKVARGPIKTSVVPDTNSAGSSRKPETQKQEDEKKPVPPASVEQHGGHYELNARMTRMVETELRDIMIKVWQELPDNPTDEAESLVVDKLRNKAGDDLRNVLGLNVTKRLLNVHNPLYVKVQFSGKPEKVHLAEFLKKYNFNAFKRIEKTVNMFAAQVKTISDFDNICSAKDVRCGDIKVTVQPIYRFTKCPPNLITSFDDKDEHASDETTTEINETDDKVDGKTEKNNSPNKVINKQNENVPPKPIVEASKTENKTVTKTVESKTVVNKPVVDNKAAANKATVENKTTGNKPIIEKTVEKPVSKPAVENKAAVNNTVVNKPSVEKPITKPVVENKTIVNKTAVSKPAVENKTVVNKPPVEKPVTKAAVENKTVVNKTAVNQPAIETKTAVNKPAAVIKTTVNKPAAENKTAVNKPSLETKEVKKPPIIAKNNETAMKSGPSPVEKQIKKADKAETEIKDKVEKKTNKFENDYDELDDHDILALMSEGIVLDECSGSDDE